MADPITDDLADMFPDEVWVTPMSYDGFGAGTPGTPFKVRARVSGKTQNIRTAEGNTVKSGMVAIIKGAYSLTTGHKFLLPTRFNPRQPKVVDVQSHTDENGAHHETVYFG